MEDRKRATATVDKQMPIGSESGTDAGSRFRLLMGGYRSPSEDLRKGGVAALVGEPGGLHVVAGSVCQTPTRRKEGQTLAFFQHDFQLLKVLQPSHIFVLERKTTSK